QVESSSRAKQSNPSHHEGRMDCFVAVAPRNDGLVGDRTSSHLALMLLRRGWFDARRGLNRPFGWLFRHVLFGFGRGYGAGRRGIVASARPGISEGFDRKRN